MAAGGLSHLAVLGRHHLDVRLAEVEGDTVAGGVQADLRRSSALSLSPPSRSLQPRTALDSTSPRCARKTRAFAPAVEGRLHLHQGVFRSRKVVLGHTDHCTRQNPPALDSVPPLRCACPLPGEMERERRRSFPYLRTPGWSRCRPAARTESCQKIGCALGTRRRLCVVGSGIGNCPRRRRDGSGGRPGSSGRLGSRPCRSGRTRV